MRIRPYREVLAAVLVIIAVMACSSTIRTIRTSLVTVTVGSQNLVVLSIEPATPWLKLKLVLARMFSAPTAQAAIPAEVQSIRLTVSGSGMEPITKLQNITGQANAVFDVEVPNGPQRHFVVEGLGAGAASLFKGEATTDLEGNPVRITINMQSYKAPVVTSMSPAQGAAGVPVLTVVTVAFSEPMDPATVNSATFLLRDSANNLVSGSVVCSGATATFIPQASLASLATYTATITTGVRSLVGVYASQDHSWSFTTKDTLPSAVIATSPVNGIVGVPVNTVIRAVFAEPMDPATITTATFIVTDAAYLPVQGTVVYSGTTATFIPTASLAVGKLYAATITTGAKDLAGNALSSNYTWAFTTDAVPNFMGLQTIVASLSDIQLSWLPATDDVTPQNSIVYLIYQATTSQGQNYASPTFTTAPGATGYTIPNPAPGTAYYFVVRARDAAGNIDANTVELGVNTLGKYVSVNSGSDTTGCGMQTNPCRTITYALTQAIDNETIYVEAGIYLWGSSGSGEGFPLSLLPGTQLLCSNGVTIDNTTGPDSTIILGAAGALVDGCEVYTNPYSSLPVIDDGGSIITVQSSTIYAYTAGNAPGILLSAASTVQNSTIVGCSGLDASCVGIQTSMGAIVATNNISGFNTGISISGGAPTIASNVLTSNSTGVEILGGNPSISNNDIINNFFVGIITSGTTTLGATISGNLISGHASFGIYVTAGTPTISGNSIFNNTNTFNTASGIYVTAGTPTITGNLIHHNDNGIYVGGGTPSIHNNSIYCNNIVSGGSNYGDIYIGITLTTGFMTNNAWDHGPSTVPSSPTTGVGSAGGCSAGIDICAIAPPNSADYTPFNNAVTNGCP